MLITLGLSSSYINNNFITCFLTKNLREYSESVINIREGFGLWILLTSREKMLDHHLSALYKELGLPKEPVREADKSYAIEIPANAPMYVRATEPGCLFRSVLGSLPEEDLEDHLIHYSKANFIGQGTGHCRLGLDAEGKKLVLIMHHPEDISYQDFKERTEEFANFVDYWKDQL